MLKQHPLTSSASLFYDGRFPKKGDNPECSARLYELIRNIEHNKISAREFERRLGDQFWSKNGPNDSPKTPFLLRNRLREGGDTLLHAIAKNGDSELLRVAFYHLGNQTLIDLLAARNLHGATPFYHMAAGGHRNLLTQLTSHFFELFSQIQQRKAGNVLGGRAGELLSTFHIPTRYGVSPLLAATYGGNTNTAITLLDEFGITGVDLEFRHSDGQRQPLSDSTLLAALRAKNLRLSESLVVHYEVMLTQGFITEEQLRDVYLYAGKLPVNDSLLKEGPQGGSLATKRNVFHFAAGLGSQRLFRRMVGVAEGLPAVESEGGVKQTLSYLLNQVGSMNSYSGLVIHQAAENKCEKITRLVLDKMDFKSNPEVLTKATSSGRTPLDIAYRACQISRYYDSEEDFNRAKSTYECFLEAYKQIVCDEGMLAILEKKRNEALSRLEAFDRGDEAWDIVRELDERLFVGPGADQFVQRIMRMYKCKEDLIWLKKATYATRVRDPEMFKRCAGKIKDLKVSDSHAISIFHLAAHIGCPEWIYCPIQKGMPVDYKSQHSFSINERYSGATPLFEAVYFVQLDIVRILKQQGADFFSKREISGSFPLSLLVWSGEAEWVLEFLNEEKKKLEKENKSLADKLNIRNKSDRGLVYLAIWSLMHHAPPNEDYKPRSDKYKRLKEAAVDLIDFLIKSEASASFVSRSIEGEPNLSLFKERQDSLPDNYDINEFLSSTPLLLGLKPLHLAAKIPEDPDLPFEQQLGVRVAKILIPAVYSATADGGPRTFRKSELGSSGLSPMHIASSLGHRAFVFLLADYNFKPTLPSADGRSPINTVIGDHVKKRQDIITFLSGYMDKYTKSGKEGDSEQPTSGFKR